MGMIINSENWHPENWDQLTLMYLKSAEGAEALAIVKAAPDLLAACKAAESILRAYIPAEQFDGHASQALQSVRAAIAAAQPTPNSDPRHSG